VEALTLEDAPQVTAANGAPQSGAQASRHRAVLEVLDRVPAQARVNDGQRQWLSNLALELKSSTPQARPPLLATHGHSVPDWHSTYYSRGENSTRHPLLRLADGVLALDPTPAAVRPNS
jgi:hypothetical protein